MDNNTEKKDFILKNDEVIKQQWDYANVSSSSKSVGSCKCSLIVTNQRLIHVQEAKNFYFSDDIQLRHIKGITTCYSHKKNMAWLGVIIVAIMTLITAIAVNVSGAHMEYMYGIPGLLFVVAIFMVLLIKPEAFLQINVKTNTEDFTGMEVRAGRTVFANSNTKKSDKNIISVHGDVAEDIARRLGGLI